MGEIEQVVPSMVAPIMLLSFVSFMRLGAIHKQASLYLTVSVWCSVTIVRHYLVNTVNWSFCVRSAR